MTPDELRVLHDRRVHGDHLASGVEHGVTWEVRARPTPGECRVSVFVPWSDALRWAVGADDVVWAGVACDAVGDESTGCILGTFVDATPDHAVEVAREWARDCAEVSRER